MTALEALRDRSRVAGAGTSLLGALVIVARHRGIHLSEAQLHRDHRVEPGGPTPEQLLQIASSSGLRALATKLSFSDLMRMGQALPAILLLKNGSAMVLLRVERQAQPPHVVAQDPGAPEDALLSLDEHRLALGWDGNVIPLKRDYRLRDEDQPFGLRLIAAQIFRDRRLVRDIAVAAIVLSLLALGPIVFWRLLIDRVVYFHSLDTLVVLCVAMVVLIIFETIFGYMRRFLVLHITARVDAQLSTYMFNKVLNLPLDFFERSSTGVITRDMNAIFKIRGFLTGQVFGTVLDSFVLLVFLPIMFFFSATLTAVVLGFCGLICLWIIKMLPVLRRKGAAAFRAEGIKNAFLVENLQGVRTVKSLALDAPAP
jgi:ATP-binding cassette subfamily B protein